MVCIASLAHILMHSGLPSPFTPLTYEWLSHGEELMKRYSFRRLTHDAVQYGSRSCRKARIQSVEPHCQQ